MDRTSLALCFTYAFNVAEVAPIIVDSGFAAVEPYVDFPVNPNVVEALMRHGLRISGVHTGQYYLDDSFRELRTGELVDVYREFVDFCSCHSVRRLSVHPCFRQSQSPAAEGLQRMRELVAYSESRGVEMAIENVGRTAYLNYLLEGIGSPALGLLYDAGHDNVSGEKLGEVLKRWGHRLTATHLSDNRGVEDSHEVPLEGDVDWEYLASVYDWSRYEGYFTAEVYLRKDPALECFLKRTHTAVSRVVDILRNGM